MERIDTWGNNDRSPDCRAIRNPQERAPAPEHDAGSGGTDGLSGGPVTPALHNPVTCSQPALMPWVGLVVAALLIVASLAGPFLVRKNIMKQPHAADQ